MTAFFPSLNISAKSLFGFGICLFAGFSPVEAQGEWKKNSSGHDVYVRTPSTPYIAPTPRYQQSTVTTRKTPDPVPDPVTVRVDDGWDHKLFFTGQKDVEGNHFVRKGGKWGLVYSNSRRFMLEPVYDSIISGDWGELYIVKAGGKWIFIDRNGMRQLATRFDSLISGFNNGQAVAVLGCCTKYTISKSGEISSGVDISPAAEKNKIVAKPVEKTAAVKKMAPVSTTAKMQAEEWYLKGNQSKESIPLDHTAEVELKKCNEAIAFYTKAIALDASQPKYLNARALVKQRLRNYAGAIKDYHAALKVDPAFALAYNNMGYAKFLAGDKEGACNDWRKAAAMGSAASADFINWRCK